MRRCCGRGRAASSEQPALALFVVWRLANARRCRTSEPVACGLAAGMRRRRTCRRSSPSIKPLGRVVGGVGRSNLDRLRVRGRCAQCANPGAGSAEPLSPPCSCCGSVARRRHCTVAALEAASSHQGHNPQGGLCSRWDVNPHLGRGSLLVWCVPWWAGHLAMCKVGPAGRWSTPPRRPRVLRGAVVEVAQGRCYVPRA